MEQKNARTKSNIGVAGAAAVLFTQITISYMLCPSTTRGTRCAPVYVRGDVFNFVAQNIRVVRVRYHNTGVRATIPRAAEQPRSAGVNEEGQTVEEMKKSSQAGGFDDERERE